MLNEGRRRSEPGRLLKKLVLRLQLSSPAKAINENNAVSQR
jgi:hypothetical protein